MNNIWFIETMKKQKKQNNMAAYQLTKTKTKLKIILGSCQNKGNNVGTFQGWQNYTKLHLLRMPRRSTYLSTVLLRNKFKGFSLNYFFVVLKLFSLLQMNQIILKKVRLFFCFSILSSLLIIISSHNLNNKFSKKVYKIQNHLSINFFLLTEYFLNANIYRNGTAFIVRPAIYDWLK